MCRNLIDIDKIEEIEVLLIIWFKVEELRVLERNLRVRVKSFINELVVYKR